MTDSTAVDVPSNPFTSEVPIGALEDGQAEMVAPHADDLVPVVDDECDVAEPGARRTAPWQTIVTVRSCSGVPSRPPCSIARVSSRFTRARSAGATSTQRRANVDFPDPGSPLVATSPPLTADR